MHSILSRPSISPSPPRETLFPPSRNSSLHKVLSFSSPSSLQQLRQLNFFELELHHARHIEEQSFQNQSFPQPFHKFCRANTKKSYDVSRDETIPENPPLSTWGWLLQWPGSPSIYNSEPTSAIKRGRKGVKLYCGRGEGLVVVSRLSVTGEKDCYNFITTRCERILFFADSFFERDARFIRETRVERKIVASMINVRISWEDRLNIDTRLIGER